VSSTWRDLWREAQPVISAEMGEEFRHFPMVAVPNERAAADPDRAIQETSARDGGPLRGVFSALRLDVFASKGIDSTRAVPASHTSSVNPMLSVDPLDLTFDIRIDDRIAMLDRGELYRVADVKPDGQGRVCLELNQIGRHDPFG